MIENGIYDGDIAIIRKTNDVQNGNIINIHDDDIIRAKQFELYLKKLCTSTTVNNEEDDGSDGSGSGANTSVLGRTNHSSTLVSSLYLLRGRAYEELDNRERAIEWYTKALISNVIKL